MQHIGEMGCLGGEIKDLILLDRLWRGVRWCIGRTLEHARLRRGGRLVGGLKEAPLEGGAGKEALLEGGAREVLPRRSRRRRLELLLPLYLGERSGARLVFMGSVGETPPGDSFGETPHRFGETPPHFGDAFGETPRWDLPRDLHLEANLAEELA